MIDRATAESVSLEVEAALTEIFARNGLTKVRLSTRYGSTLDLKITAAEETIDAATGINVTSPEALEFKRYAYSLGLSESILGQRFSYLGRSYTFKGYKRANTRYPFIALADDGRSYKLPRDVIGALEVIDLWR